MNMADIIATELFDFMSQLPRVNGAVDRELRKAFAEYQRDMLAMVASADVAGVGANFYQQKRALALVKSVNTLTAKTYRDLYKNTEAELVELAGASAATGVTAINGALGGEVLTNTLTSPQLKYLVKHSVIDGATSAEWWSKQAVDTSFKFKSAVQDGLLNGEGTDYITRRIRGTKANNYTDGFMNTAYNNARSLTHTSIQKVSNEARLETWKENDDVIEGIEWLSTLDGHTTQICKALDGKVWDNDKKPVGHDKEWPSATAHWQCRSTQVPVLKGFGDLPKAKQDEFKGERASMDGSKPASLDYNEWLKEKDKTNSAFVKKTLGREKYKIWKAKGLSMSDMTDQHNNPLTVAQLREKFGLKFKPPKPKAPVKVVKPVKPVEVVKPVKYMPKKKAVELLEAEMRKGAQDSRYVMRTDDGTPAIRFGRWSTRSGRAEQSSFFGKADVGRLNADTASVLLHAINEANAIAAKLGVQPIRGVSTKVHDALASMGDAILRVQTKFFTENATVANQSASLKKLADMKAKAAAKKAQYFEMKTEWTEKYAAWSYSERAAFSKEYNKVINSYNRYNRQLQELEYRQGKSGAVSKWKVGDDLKKRPHNAFEYFPAGEDGIKNTVFHEFGHHVHQQFRVGTEWGYKNPVLEKVVDKLWTNHKRVAATRYSDKIGSEGKEWFAESFSLYYMGRKELLDPMFIKLMESLEKGTFDHFSKGFI